MVEYSKLKEKQHLASSFNRWKRQKRKEDAKKHFAQCLMKKVMNEQVHDGKPHIALAIFMSCR